jgi:hypothetical protein
MEGRQDKRAEVGEQKIHETTAERGVQNRGQNAPIGSSADDPQGHL